MGKLSELRSCRYFSDLDEIDLALLTTVLQMRSLQRNEMLFSAGQPSDALLVIKQGQISILETIFTEGEPLCEVALLGPTFHLVDAKVTSPEAVLWSLSHQAFTRLLKVRPTLAARMLRNIGLQLHQRVHQTMSLQ